MLGEADHEIYGRSRTPSNLHPTNNLLDGVGLHFALQALFLQVAGSTNRS